MFAATFSRHHRSEKEKEEEKKKVKRQKTIVASHALAAGAGLLSRNEASPWG